MRRQHGVWADFSAARHESRSTKNTKATKGDIHAPAAPRIASAAPPPYDYPLPTSDRIQTTGEETLWRGSVSHWHYAGRWLVILLLIGVGIASFA